MTGSYAVRILSHLDAEESTHDARGISFEEADALESLVVNSGEKVCNGVTRSHPNPSLLTNRFFQRNVQKGRRPSPPPRSIPSSGSGHMQRVPAGAPQAPRGGYGPRRSPDLPPVLREFRSRSCCGCCGCCSCSSSSSSCSGCSPKKSCRSASCRPPSCCA